MDKILVEIFVPAASKSFDVFIPQTSKLGDIAALLAKALSDLSNGKYKSDSNSILCDAESGDILDVNLSVYELKIKNGSRLMLI